MLLRLAPVSPLAFGALRLVLVPALLVWILARLGGMEGSRFAMAEPLWLLLGLGVNQMVLAIFALRMQWVLRLCAVRIGWPAALRIHLESMFYFFAVPMTVGLEVARFVKIRAIDPQASKAGLTAALLLDRLLGAGSALAVAVLCLPLVRTRIPFETSPAWILSALGAAAALGLGLLLWRRSRGWLAQSWRLTQGRRLGLVALFVLSMAMHVLFAAGVQFAARAFGLPVSLADTVFAVAGGMLLVAVPVSLAGLGPAEAGAAGLFVALGYTPAVALTAGALPYLARLVAALEGGALELVESGTATVSATRRLIHGRRTP